MRPGSERLQWGLVAGAALAVATTFGIAWPRIRLDEPVTPQDIDSMAGVGSTADDEDSLNLNSTPRNGRREEPAVPGGEDFANGSASVPGGPPSDPAEPVWRDFSYSLPSARARSDGAASRMRGDVVAPLTARSSGRTTSGDETSSADPDLGMLQSPGARGKPEVMPSLSAEKAGDSGEGKGRERDYYESFRKMARTNPVELERRASELLAESGPDCRRVALLRALYDTSSPAALSTFIEAIRTLPDVADPGLMSVPAFAASFLCEHAGADAGARSVVEEVLWGFSSPPGFRRQMVETLTRIASSDDLNRLSTRLLMERDPEMLAGIVAGLRANAAGGDQAQYLLANLPPLEIREEKTDE